MKKKKERNFGNWKQLFVVLKRSHIPWLLILLAFGLNLFVNELLLKIPVTTGKLMAGDLSDKALYDAILFYAIYAVVLCSNSTLQAIVVCLTKRNARSALWKKMLNTEIKYYDQNDPLDLMSILGNDLTSAMSNLVFLMIGVLPDLYYVVRALMEVSSYNMLLMVILLIFMPLKSIYTMIIGRFDYRMQSNLYARIGGLTGYLAERINNLPLIKAYTQEKQESEFGYRVCDDLYRANMNVFKLSAVDQAMHSVFMLLENISVMILAVLLLRDGKIVMAEWVAFFFFFQNITAKFDVLMADWVSVKTIQGSVARTAEVYQAEEETFAEETNRYPDGDLVFDHVSFSYGDTIALQDVSFTVPQGKTTAIVGLCGSGKTTSISLLERFYAADKGKVCLGEHEIKKMALKEYRDRFGYVQQNPEVFSGTVREALTYGISREIDDEELYEAAKKTDFYEYLKQQSDGLDTVLQQGGDSLSGGQRQRLVLTRELLRGADILLLDEPTSALDVHAAGKVKDVILSSFAGKTILMITHDLQLLHDMDHIIVLEQGRVAGSGSYDQLMASCALFRDMVFTQGETGEAML